MAPKLSIIMLNWNGIDFLGPCLESIERQTYRDFEVILVDNGSTDASLSFVRNKFPHVNIIENTCNLGFSKANNMGIKSAKGEFILTLNNDTTLESKCIESIMDKALNSAGDAGMWASKILSMKDKETIDSVGGLLIYGDGIARGRGRGEIDNGQFDHIEEILCPSACCALYRKTAIDSVGGFDDDFFAYCEDTDLGLRMQLAGWKSLSAPEAIVYHYYSGTTGKYSSMKARLVERNHSWLAVKNFPALMLLAMPFHTVWRWFVQAMSIIKGSGATAKYAEATPFTEILLLPFISILSTIKGLWKMWKKRKGVRKNKALSDFEFKKLISKNRISAKELLKE